MSSGERSWSESDATWYAKDNGFVSARAMEAAHVPIVELAVSLLAEAGSRRRVLDLGCGNGALLRRICERDARAVPGGIDKDPGKIERARMLLPQFHDRLWVGDIFVDESPWMATPSFDVVLLMPGRLLEVGLDRRTELRRKLGTGGRLLVYAYDDWLTKYANLARITEDAGLSFIEQGPHASVGIAQVPPE
ncbi:class I SAM-dependent methyltransferase [Sorangium sp. So ce1128]